MHACHRERVEVGGQSAGGVSLQRAGPRDGLQVVSVGHVCLVSRLTDDPGSPLIFVHYFKYLPRVLSTFPSRQRF